MIQTFALRSMKPHSNCTILLLLYIDAIKTSDFDESAHIPYLFLMLINFCVNIYFGEHYYGHTHTDVQRIQKNFYVTSWWLS